VPVPLSDSRRRYLAMNWMITECRENRDRRMHVYEKLSQELLMAFEKEGNVVKKKHEMHKMAESNRAYAHYRCSCCSFSSAVSSVSGMSYASLRISGSR
ncbi:hypothetical protein CRUP_026640, partial [Coryphaenoides rupestris]